MSEPERCASDPLASMSFDEAMVRHLELRFTFMVAVMMRRPVDEVHAAKMALIGFNPYLFEVRRD